MSSQLNLQAPIALNDAENEHKFSYLSINPLSGNTLQQVLQEDKNAKQPLTFWQRIKISQNLLIELDKLHNKLGIIHRNFTPENINISFPQTGQVNVFISNCDSAKPNYEDDENQSRRHSALAYISYEALSNKNTSEKSDVLACGRILASVWKAKDAKQIMHELRLSGLPARLAAQEMARFYPIVNLNLAGVNAGEKQRLRKLLRRSQAKNTRTRPATSELLHCFNRIEEIYNIQAKTTAIIAEAVNHSSSYPTLLNILQQLHNQTKASFYKLNKRKRATLRDFNKVSHLTTKASEFVIQLLSTTSDIRKQQLFQDYKNFCYERMQPKFQKIMYDILVWATHFVSQTSIAFTYIHHDINQNNKLHKKIHNICLHIFKKGIKQKYLTNEPSEQLVISASALFSANAKNTYLKPKPHMR
jgi:serine/threonine protein kinase